MTNLTEDEQKLIVNFVELLTVLSVHPEMLSIGGYNLNQIAGVLADKLGEELTFSSVAPVAVAYYSAKNDPISLIKAQVWEVLGKQSDERFDVDLWNSAFED